ncbi:MAG: hypothetical protein QOH06_1921 [Acidobacteriota bacterium]|jgi:hypothetical protein|nr:hypothetical protein [Acidobacteriota bacterium]
MLGLFLLTTPAHGTLPYTTHPAGPICNEGTETPPIALTWKQLPEAGSIAKLAATNMQLAVTNNTTVSLRVRVLVAGALDEVRETLEVGEAVVQPKSTSILTVDLSRFKRDLGTLRFSGRMVAKGFARPVSGGIVSDLAYSPYAYIHKEAGRLVAYRSDALARYYRAGDFANRAERQRRWATNRGLRLGGIGTLGTGLNLTDNDGGPREGTQP